MADLIADCKALRSLYTIHTSELPEQWTPELPSTGQCHVTALILWSRYGGRIMAADVYLTLQHRKVLHYWNDIDGVRVDPTWDQFQWERAICGEEWDATHEPIQDGTATKRTLLLKRFNQVSVNG